MTNQTSALKPLSLPFEYRLLAYAMRETDGAEFVLVKHLTNRYTPYVTYRLEYDRPNASKRFCGLGHYLTSFDRAMDDWSERVGSAQTELVD